MYKTTSYKFQFLIGIINPAAPADITKDRIGFNSL